jgi:hypothetical protein
MLSALCRLLDQKSGFAAMRWKPLGVGVLTSILPPAP